MKRKNYSHFSSSEGCSFTEKLAHIKKWLWLPASFLAIFLSITILIKTEPKPDAHQQAHPEIQECLLRMALPPKMAPYPDKSKAHFSLQSEVWRKDVEKQLRKKGYADSLTPFWQNSMQAFLKDTGGKNKLCSPVSIYMALSILAQSTGGDTRQEILDVLQCPSMEALQKQAGDVWNAQYRNDGVTTMVMANSIWLREDLMYRQKALDTLADHFYTSTFQGIPGSPEMDAALQAWLNEQTGGLLKKQAGKIHLNPDTILALSSTLHYKAQWSQEFRQSTTAEGSFHHPSGPLQIPFMHRTGSGTYYQGKHFSATALPMQNGGGTLWLLLPEEGMTPEQLAQEEEIYRFLNAPQEWKNKKQGIISLSLPRFDVDSQFDLITGLQELGIKKAFQVGADFSGVLNTHKPVYLSECNHAVRVTADEEGVSGAAFTVMVVDNMSSAIPQEVIHFTLDRPFLFVLTSPDHLPVFTGIINHP